MAEKAVAIVRRSMGALVVLPGGSRSSRFGEMMTMELLNVSMDGRASPRGAVPRASVTNRRSHLIQWVEFWTR